MHQIIAKAQSLVRATPASVYNAFIDPSVMSKFWFTRRDNGLVEGESVQWFIGDAADAYAIEVRVKELVNAEKIRTEWGDGITFTQVEWQIEDMGPEGTALKITESGFTGTDSDIINQALDSTGGFNQVIIALKAYLEHDSVINVVDDHVEI